MPASSPTGPTRQGSSPERGSGSSASAPLSAPAGEILRFGWLLVLVGGVVLFELLRRTAVSTQNPNLIPALLFVGAMVVPAAFVTFIYARPLNYDVPGGVIAAIAATGGVIGITVAAILEYDTLHRLGALPMLAVGLIEESAKLLVPAAILIGSRRYRRPADGLLIGVASGAGFAAFETMGYAFVTLANSQGNLAKVDGVLLLRGVLSPAAHMAWTGLTAAALWAAAQAHWSRPAAARFAATFVFAIALHTAWDSIDTLVGYAVIAALGLGALFVTAQRMHLDRP